MNITINAPITDFTLPATGAKNIKLSDLKGQKVIIYFYPKDHTPGCTTEAKDFRDYYSNFMAKNTVILGVSRDSIRTHENFKAKHNLQFDLLSDKDEILCKMFGVLKLKNMFGREYIGIERSTFLIDENGVLIKEWRKVKVADHIEEVLKSIE